MSNEDPYKCPKCGTHNKVLSFTQKLGENIPSTIVGSALTWIAISISFGTGVTVLAATAAYQYMNGYTITCSHCQGTFKVKE